MKKSLMLFAVFAALSCTFSRASVAAPEPSPQAVEFKAAPAAFAHIAHASFELVAVERTPDLGLILTHQSAPAPASFRLTGTLARADEPAQRPAIASSDPANADPSRPERPRMQRKLT